MQFHAEAFNLAEQRGLLQRPEVEESRQHLPEWLADLQTPGERAIMEQALSIAVPESLMDFWRLPALVCLLDAWGELTYLHHAMLYGPEVWPWAVVDYLEFAMEGHSGESWVVEVSGDADPPVCHGFLGSGPPETTNIRFSTFIREQVQEGISRGWQLRKHFRCYSYHVRLLPLSAGPVEEVVEIIAYTGQSIRDLVAQRYPGREIMGVRRKARSL